MESVSLWIGPVPLQKAAFAVLLSAAAFMKRYQPEPLPLVIPMALHAAGTVLSPVCPAVHLIVESLRLCYV